MNADEEDSNDEAVVQQVKRGRKVKFSIFRYLLQTTTDELLEHMEVRQVERDEEDPACNIPELIRRTKCDTRTCKNFDHNCLVINPRSHNSLSANDFVTWDLAIKKGGGKATLDLPPLTLRGTPVIRDRDIPVAILRTKLLKS